MTPSTSQRGTIANKFLLRKVRSPHHIIVSSNPVWAARQGDVLFEDWPRWLDELHRHLVTLMRSMDRDNCSDSGSNKVILSTSDAVATSGFPAVTILQELEQIMAILSIAAATNTHDSDVSATTSSGVREAQPPVGWGVNLLLEVGYSYGTVLDVYCEILNGTHRDDIALDVIDDGAFSVDAREIAVANDSYILHLLEGILFTLVQWFEVSMKHSITRGRDGSSDTALSELLRYNGSSGASGLLTAHTHAEEQVEEKSGRQGDAKLAEVFDMVTSKVMTLADDRSFDGASPLPAVQAYGKFRKDLMARLCADLEAAKLLQRRFVSDQ